MCRCALVCATPANTATLRTAYDRLNDRFPLACSMCVCLHVCASDQCACVIVNRENGRCLHSIYNSQTNTNENGVLVVYEYVCAHTKLSLMPTRKVSQSLRKIRRMRFIILIHKHRIIATKPSESNV